MSTTEDLSILQRPKPERYYDAFEIHRNKELGITGVVDFWGDRYNADELRLYLSQITGQDIPPTGFKVIHRSSSRLTDKEAEAEEISRVTGAIRKVLEVNHWEPESVACLSFNCGTPISDHYGDHIAYNTGLRNADVISTAAACNSGARGMQRVVADPNGIYRDRRVLSAAIEGMTRIVRDLDTDQADPFSNSVFGNGLSVVSYVPGKSFSHIASRTLLKEDIEGNLAARPTYKINYDDDELLQKFGNEERIKVPIPKKGRISMNPLQTGLMFLDIAEEVTVQTLNSHQELVRGREIEDKPINTYISHHPTFGVFKRLPIRLRRRGVIVPNIPWVVNEGNLSGATSQVAFARIMERIKPEERFLYLGFGAGMSATAMVLEAGKFRRIINR